MSMFNISKLHAENYNLRNAFTNDLIGTAKMPCLVDKRTLVPSPVAYREKTNEWFKNTLVIDDSCGYGIKCGRQMNGKYIVCLDFDIYIKKTDSDCKICKKYLDDYNGVCGSEDGMYESSTEGNWNVLCDITDCTDLIELCEQRTTETFKPIPNCGLEFQITKHQVIPPTATPCKKTGNADKRREFSDNAYPFKIVQSADSVHQYLGKLLTINQPKPYIAGTETTANKTNRKLIEQYTEMLMNGLNFHMTDYNNYLKISGVMKTNGFSKELFCDWVATTNPKDDTHLQLWDAPCKYENMNLGVLNNICKSVNPEFYKNWKEKWFSSKYIPWDIITKGIGDLAPFIAKHLRDKLVYCNERFYECNSKNNLWYLVNEPTNILSTLIGDCLDYTIASISNKIPISADEKEKEELRAKRAEYTTKYIKWRSISEISLMKNNLKTLIRDDDFAKKLNKTSGKFAFKNGILDFRTGKFEYGIEADDYLTFTTSHNYDPSPDKRDKDKEAYLLGVMKEICNNCDEDLEYFLSVIGYSITGCSSLEKSLWYLIDGTEGALGDNGKSLIFAFLTETIPEYVMKTTAGFLEARNTKVHKQLCGMKGKRVVWADEGTKNKVNDELLKVIPDGRTIENEVMFGTTEMIDITFKLFCCSNNKTNIGEGQNAVFNRYNEIPFKSHFDRTGERIVAIPEKLLFKATLGLGDELIKNYCESFLHILIDYGKRYFKSGLAKKSQSVIQATNATRMANDELITWFNDNFERGDIKDYKCSLHDMKNLKPEYFEDATTTKKLYKDMKEKMGYEYNRLLRGFGTYDKWDKTANKNVTIQIRGGFSGFRIKQEEPEEEPETQN